MILYYFLKIKIEHILQFLYHKYKKHIIFKIELVFLLA